MATTQPGPVTQPAVGVPPIVETKLPNQPKTEEDPDFWWGPVRRHTCYEGAWTGAARPKYPKVFRPYGSNTRERVVGKRTFTGMTNLGYATEIVESRPSPPFLPPSATLGQSGAPSVLRNVSALGRGNHHWLFQGGPSHS